MTRTKNDINTLPLFNKQGHGGGKDKSPHNATLSSSSRENEGFKQALDGDLISPPGIDQ